MSTPFGGTGVPASVPASIPVSLPGPVSGAVPGALPGLPKAGAGPAENTSFNFLLIVGLVALAQVAIVGLLRRITGNHAELEDDGIVGI